MDPFEEECIELIGESEQRSKPIVHQAWVFDEDESLPEPPPATSTRPKVATETCMYNGVEELVDEDSAIAIGTVVPAVEDLSDVKEINMLISAKAHIQDPKKPGISYMKYIRGCICLGYDHNEGDKRRLITSIDLLVGHGCHIQHR